MQHKRKQINGSAKMYKLGKKPVQLWLTPKEIAKLRRAAKLARRSLAGYAKLHVLDAATQDVLLADSVRMNSNRPNPKGVTP